MARKQDGHGENPPTGEQLAPPPCPKLTAFTVSRLWLDCLSSSRFGGKLRRTQLIACCGLSEEPSAQSLDALDSVGCGRAARTAQGSSAQPSRPVCAAPLSCRGA